MSPDSPLRARLLEASTRRVHRAFYREPYSRTYHLFTLAIHRLLAAVLDLLMYGCCDLQERG